MISNVINKLPSVRQYISFKSKNRKLNSDINKKEMTLKTGQNKILQIMDLKNLTDDGLSNLLIRRSNCLPATIEDYFYVTGLYVNGTKNFEFLNKIYQELNPKLAERIEKKQDGVLFKENYLPEVEFVNRITQKINSLKNNEISEKVLKECVSSISKEYFKKPVCRKKIFLY